MMQISESQTQKNSLFNAMSRFIGAVDNMDQTVMVPSLLRDVPLEEEREVAALKSPQSELDYDTDMYSYYQLLKSIRRDMEWGVRFSGVERREERRQQPELISRMDSEGEEGSGEEEEEEEESLQKQFQFHLAGLQGVLSKLTRQADTLTDKYKKEIIGGFGH